MKVIILKVHFLQIHRTAGKPACQPTTSHPVRPLLWLSLTINSFQNLSGVHSTQCHSNSCFYGGITLARLLSNHGPWTSVWQGLHLVARNGNLRSSHLARADIWSINWLINPIIYCNAPPPLLYMKQQPPNHSPQAPNQFQTETCQTTKLYYCAYFVLRLLKKE